MALISVEQVRQLADEFRDRFTTPEAFEESWNRLRAKFPRPSYESARRWLVEDLQVDQVMCAAIVREPLLPTQSTYATNDCPHCGGKLYVRLDRQPGEQGFGQAVRCQFCSDPEHGPTCPDCQAKIDAKMPETASAGAEFRKRNYVAELAQRMRLRPASADERQTPTSDEIRMAGQDLEAYRRSPEYQSALEELRVRGRE